MAVERSIDPNARLRLNEVEKKLESIGNQPTSAPSTSTDSRSDIYYHKGRSGRSGIGVPKPSSSAGTIIVSVVGATGLTVLRNILDAKRQNTFQPVISGFVVGTFLLIMALFTEELAVAFALLLLVSSVLLNATKILAKTTS